MNFYMEHPKTIHAAERYYRVEKKSFLTMAIIGMIVCIGILLIPFIAQRQKIEYEPGLEKACVITVICLQAFVYLTFWLIHRMMKNFRLYLMRTITFDENKIILRDGGGCTCAEISFKNISKVMLQDERLELKGVSYSVGRFIFKEKCRCICLYMADAVSVKDPSPKTSFLNDDYTIIFPYRDEAWNILCEKFPSNKILS